MHFPAQFLDVDEKAITIYFNSLPRDHRVLRVEISKLAFAPYLKMTIVRIASIKFVSNRRHATT